jgi:oxygen-independent coproporphyrinogen-3 oxidase
MNFGIYIHIPFCTTKCNYCSFVIKPWREDVAQRYQRALVRELADFFSRIGSWGVVDSIYFGGGTPSLVPAEYIAEILSTCWNLIEITPECEISLEANPGTLTPGKLALYRESGVTRISLGAQTFDDPGLAAIGRDHTSSDVAASLRLLKAHGFANLNLDLILGLPGQDRSGWCKNLDRVAELAPSHVSIYMLELDEKSPLYHLVARGRRSLPDEDYVSDWYLQTISRLSELGFDHYEISNFALPGFYCRHNMKYWRRRPVLGFGIGSHSFDGNARYANTASITEYLRRIEQGVSPVEWRRPVKENEDLQETLFLGLRLRQGLDWDELDREFGADRISRYEKPLRDLTSEGLIEWRGPSVRLTPRGMLLSNEIFQLFV